MKEPWPQKSQEKTENSYEHWFAQKRLCFQLNPFFHRSLLFQKQLGESNVG